MKIMQALIIGIILIYTMNLHAQQKSGNIDQASSLSTISSIDSLLNKMPGTMIEKYSGTFMNEIFKREISGNLLAVSGSYKKLGKMKNPSAAVYDFLSNNGWKELTQFAADGPDGTVFAFSKNKLLCFVQGHWDGGDDSDSTYVPSDAYLISVLCGK